MLRKVLTGKCIERVLWLSERGFLPNPFWAPPCKDAEFIIFKLLKIFTVKKDGCFTTTCLHSPLKSTCVFQIILNFPEKTGMKPLLSFALLTLLLVSCIGKEIKSSPDENAVVYPQLVGERLDDDFPLMQIPYKIDSVFFENDSAVNYEKGNMSIDLVKLLSKSLASDEASDRERYYLNDFYQIAEAKENSTYEKLKNSLDIGMTENASCKSIGRVEFGDTMAVLVWEINYKSFDACPFFSGHHVLGTLIKNGNVISCMQLASHESSADAPMSIELFQLASISEKGIITVKNHTSTNEELIVVEKAESFFKYKITDTGFKAIK